jgi:peroxiredoxin
VAISPQRGEFLGELVRKHDLTFDLLSDSGNRVAAKYGIVFSLPDELRKVYMARGTDLPRFNGDDSWTLPMPSRFIMDRQGIIRMAYANPDHSVRTEPSDTIEALKALK